MIPLTQAKPAKLSLSHRCRHSVAVVIFASVLSAQAAPTVTPTEPAAIATESVETTGEATSLTPSLTTEAAANNSTLETQRQPSYSALSADNQALLTNNERLQRELDDLQTQVNVLIYEGKGQLFMYGALTVLISLLSGGFISWLIFARRERW